MGEKLYQSPKGLFDFQAEGVAYCYARPENIAVWDTGIGKTHLGMATAAMLFEDDLIDHVLLVAEKSKLDPDEWPRDLDTFTKLTWGLYHGTPAKRAKMLADPPQVILTTYETARNDAGRLVEVKGRKTPKLIPHVLIEALRGKRIFIVYDEMTKLGNRSSGLHKAHALLIKELREGEGTRILGLTATPIERSPENFYNLGRILIPGYMGTVAQFERDYVRYRDLFGRPTFKNLSRDEGLDPEVTPFTDRIAPIMLRKRKSDSDVKKQFPETVEEFTYVDLDRRQREFYEAVEEVFADADPRHLWRTRRQIAGHPMALLHSEAQMARQIVSYVGEDTIASMSSTKSRRLVEYLLPLVKGQGAQVVVFTFFGPSMIPHLQAELEAVKPEPFKVATYYGKMGDKEKTQSKLDFREGKYEVLLASDAGARGINLPEAMYACVEINTQVLNADLQWVSAWSLQVGESVVGCDEELLGRRRWQVGEVVQNVIQERQCVSVLLSNGDEMVVTPDHRMLVRSGKGILQWREAQDLRAGWKIPRYLDVWEAGDTFDDGWVSGMADGESCLTSTGRGQQLHIAQNPGPVWDRLWKIISGRGFTVTRRLHILGGQAERMKWLGVFSPMRLISSWRKWVPGRSQIRSIENPVVVSVEDAGVREVAVMETTIRTFMGAGYMNHNCEYELALTHAMRTQRLNRIHRIDSEHSSVTFQSFIVRDSVEEEIAATTLARNEWSDKILDGDNPGGDFISASIRRRMMERAKTV